MRKWISGQNILERHNIEGLDLFEYVKKGLQPYNQKEELKPRPDVSEKLSELKKQKENLAILERSINKPIDQNSIRQMILNARQELSGMDDKKKITRYKKTINSIESELPQYNLYSWEDYSLPYSEEKAIEIINDLMNSLFKTCSVVSGHRRTFVFLTNQSQVKDSLKRRNNGIQMNTSTVIHDDDLKSVLWKRLLFQCLKKLSQILRPPICGNDNRKKSSSWFRSFTFLFVSTTYPAFTVLSPADEPLYDHLMIVNVSPMVPYCCKDHFLIVILGPYFRNG